MAPLSALDGRVEGRHDIELRDIRHALNARLGYCGGYAWLSQRTLTKVVLGRCTGRALERVQELVDMGEFCRVTARGRGQGKGRTLYFKPWPSLRHAVLRELANQKMPLAATHAAERCFDRHLERVFFRQKNGAPRHQQGVSKRDSQTEKDERTALDRPISDPNGPPGSHPTPSPRASAPQPIRLLSKHGRELRRLGVRAGSP